MDPNLQNAYTNILREELHPALFCMAPIALALCAAKAQQALGMQPTAVTVSVSQTVKKRVKNVVIPHTNGLKGLRAAVAAGILCGDAENGLKGIGTVTEEQRAAVLRFLDTVHIDVVCTEADGPIDVSVTLYARTSYARAVMADRAGRVTEIMKNGEVLFHEPVSVPNEDRQIDRACLNVPDILKYAESVGLDAVKDLLNAQIAQNTAIAEEGMRHAYGAQIGRMLLMEHPNDRKTIVKAAAAAGGDARTGGSELPVMHLCGSAAQGIAATVPVVTFAREIGADAERMYRALLLTDLLTVYLNVLTKPSANRCSTCAAGCAVGAAIAYLSGSDETTVAQTLWNAVSLRAETVCDGADASCAVKLASAIDVGFLGLSMAQRQPAEDGILASIDGLLRRALQDRSA